MQSKASHDNHVVMKHAFASFPRSGNMAMLVVKENRESPLAAYDWGDSPRTPNSAMGAWPCLGSVVAANLHGGQGSDMCRPQASLHLCA